MALDPSIIELLSIALGPTGGAWLAVKHSLNGTKKRVEDIQSAVSVLDAKVTGLDVRLTDHLHTVNDNHP